MKKLGFNWPEKFNCDSLPDRADGSNILCLDFNMPKRYIPEIKPEAPPVRVLEMTLYPIQCLARLSDTKNRKKWSLRGEISEFSSVFN